jgi:hypothetical protein
MGPVPKRRIDIEGPSSASGGMMAFTRDPSGRRASTIGEDSSTRRPYARNNAVDNLQQVAIVAEAGIYPAQDAAFFNEYVILVVHQDVGDLRILQQRLQRPSPKTSSSRSF